MTQVSPSIKLLLKPQYYDSEGYTDNLVESQVCVHVCMYNYKYS